MEPWRGRDWKEGTKKAKEEEGKKNDGDEHKEEDDVVYRLLNEGKKVRQSFTEVKRGGRAGPSTVLPAVPIYCGPNFAPLPPTFVAPLGPIAEPIPSTEPKLTKSDIQYHKPKRAASEGEILIVMMCVECGRVPSPTVYYVSCKTAGHMLCLNCAQTTPICPGKGDQCGATLVKSKNSLYKVLYDKATFGCPYEALGCKVDTLGGLLTAHMKQCDYRPNVECPFNTCRVGRISEFAYLDHIRAHHGVSVVEIEAYRVRIEYGRIDFGGRGSKKAPKETRWVQVVLRVSGSYFAFVFEALDKSVIMWCAHMSDKKYEPDGRNFDGRISLRNSSGTSTKIWEGPVATVDRSFEDIIEAGDCLEVSKTVVRTKYGYNYGEMEMFNVDIKIVERKTKRMDAPVLKKKPADADGAQQLEAGTLASPVSDTRVNVIVRPNSAIIMDAKMPRYIVIKGTEISNAQSPEGKKAELLPMIPILDQPVVDTDKLQKPLVPASAQETMHAEKLDKPLVPGLDQEAVDTDQLDKPLVPGFDEEAVDTDNLVKPLVLASEQELLHAGELDEPLVPALEQIPTTHFNHLY